MSKALNHAYAGHLIEKMNELPSVGLKAVTRHVFKHAALATYQDSGEAAYNWNIAWDGESKVPYINSKGMAPVGDAYEHRGAGHHEVVSALLDEARASMPTEVVESAKVYNPIEDTAHEIAADIQTAGTHAINPAEVNAIAERTVNAHLLRSH